ncbi:MAG TPA: alkaline phosphatase D family protein [Vicinamibacterales bacterium]|nr:alkaline phosphatase D family protein [Vicinamibacterales bacterium]
MNRSHPLESWLHRHVSRRSLLAGGLALCGLPYARVYAARPASARRWTANPFALGVSSGDPTPDGVVLWTRIGADPLDGAIEPVPIDVTWEVAEDDRFATIVKRGATSARPEWAHSVHVEVEGLRPDRWYWYRFRTGSEESPIGRTRTLPAAGADVDRLRFAFASCQHYEQGLFTAHRHLANEDVNLIFHLGDYIYEGPGMDGRVRKHHGLECIALDDYRRRYAQYQLDPDLQAAQAACPWFVTPDDHEVDNNYAGELSERLDPVDVFLLRRAAAYQAYYEHMPLRRSSVPRGPSLQLYRQCSYGTLASFCILDTRQYRTDQPCGDGSKAPCPAMADPAATLLGADQERWLFDALDKSRARWHVIPQQVMMAKVDLAAGPDERYSMDQWSAYDAGRTRVLDFFATRRPANPVVLTGDIHSSWVNDLKVDFRDPKSPAVATELVGTSLSSGGDGSTGETRMKSMMAENPFVKYYNGQRGYVVCEMRRGFLTADYRVVEYVSRPGAPMTLAASFRIEDGKPGAVRDR